MFIDFNVMRMYMNTIYSIVNVNILCVNFYYFYGIHSRVESRESVSPNRMTR